MRLIVSTMKDEGPFILEWIAYYLFLGFDHFIINTNDCSDGTDKIIMRLQELGIASHIDNPAPWKYGPQASAYDNAMAHPKYKQADWVMVCDADEFLDIKVGNNTLDDLFEACPKANVFAFAWLLFGHSGLVEFRDQFVTEQMVHSANPHQIYPHQTRALKTLFRNNGIYRVASTHRPKRPYPNRVKEARWVDGDGQQMQGFDHQGWAFWHTGQGFGTKMARMNHYAVRSVESYLMKRMRGDVNTTSFHDKMEASGHAYWRLHCWNIEQNKGIAGRTERMCPFFEQLMRDPDLADLHRKAVKYHKGRISDLRKTPQAIDFVERFEKFDHDRIVLLKDNVFSDPNAGFDMQTFDASSFLRNMQMARFKELKTKQIVKKWPWYTNLDALETSHDKDLINKITDPKNTNGQAFGLLPALPEPLLRGIKDALEVARNKPEVTSKTARFLNAISRARNKTWLLIGGRDHDLIDAILQQKQTETLYLIEPWGFRSAETVVDILAPDTKRTALDHAFFQTMLVYAEQIKSGRLRICRSTPMLALRLFEDAFFDVVMIHGTRRKRRAKVLLDIVEEKMKPDGQLVLDGYRRHGAQGPDMCEAINGFIAEKPNTRRIGAVDQNLLAIELLV